VPHEGTLISEAGIGAVEGKSALRMRRGQLAERIARIDLRRRAYRSPTHHLP